MSSNLYHRRGWLPGLVWHAAWHLRELWRNPAYRALHRFHHQLSRFGRRTAAEISFGRSSIRICDAPSFLSAWDEIFVNRIYDLGPLDHEPCLVDAGANIGLAALYWRQRYGKFKYIGFEPDPTVAECCRHNLKTWGVNGEVVQVALGKADGVLSFMQDGADGGRLVSDQALGGGEVIKVSVRRLSEYLPARVDLLKIDVEGAESEVLEDVSPLLSRVSALFVEWHGKSGATGLGALITRLEEAGFDCYPQVVEGPTMPFILRKQAGTFSQNLNLYAVRPCSI